MAQPANVIYLPPGVVPINQPQQQPSASPGIPFDRNFFEKVLPGSVQAFCEQAKCDSPIVELFTIDGTRHFLKGISGVSDTWVALHTQSADHDHAIQAFLPYQTIFRVEIHPEEDAKQRRLGFITSWNDKPKEEQPKSQ
jgi:hypothetical protein